MEPVFCIIFAYNLQGKAKSATSETGPNPRFANGARVTFRPLLASSKRRAKTSRSGAVSPKELTMGVSDLEGLARRTGFSKPHVPDRLMIRVCKILATPERPYRNTCPPWRQSIHGFFHDPPLERGSGLERSSWKAQERLRRARPGPDASGGFGTSGRESRVQADRVRMLPGRPPDGI